VSAIEEGMGSPDILLAAADRALFAAKEQGGDRVCRADRPRRAPPIPRPVPTPTPLRDLTGLRALVVDDDPATLGSTGRLLTRMGCVVTTVESVGDALRVLTGPEEVDVLLTDIVMPEMSGFTLVDVATRVRPNLAVLYMSGHPHEEVYWGGSPGACSSFLAKPMEVDELRAALIDLLEVAPDVDGVGRDTPAPEPGATAVAAAEAEPPQPSPVNILPPPRINGKILIVDDDSLVVQALQRLFLRAGYAEPIGLTDSREVREVLESESVDLLILDLHMPELDGFQMLAALATWIPPEEYLPVLALTADSDPTVRRRALAAGAMDFLSKPFDPAEAEARARNLLETRFLTLRVAEQRDTLEHRVLARTSELADTRTEILHRLARAAEYRDDVTGRHADRVGMLSSRLAEEIGLPPMEVDLIRRTAPLHDIGKIGVPDAVLRKPGQLTPTEYELMKTHTTIGAQILGGSRHRILQLAAEIAGSHHERWDGAGYPRGIAGEAIPLAARIVTVADTFDTIAHTRPYQDARALEAAVEEIIRCADSHFDPKVVEAFQAIIRRVGLDGLHELSDPIEPLRDTTDSGAATPSTW
jgi:putative two-component system response regulator